MHTPPEGIPLSDIVNRPLRTMGDEPFNVIERVELTDDVPDEPAVETPVNGYTTFLANGQSAVYPPKTVGDYAHEVPAVNPRVAPAVTFEDKVLQELGSLSARVDAVLTGQLVADSKLDFLGTSMAWLTQTFNGIQQAAMNMPGLMGGMVRKMTSGGK